MPADLRRWRCPSAGDMIAAVVRASHRLLMGAMLDATMCGALKPPQASMPSPYCGAFPRAPTRMLCPCNRISCCAAASRRGSWQPSFHILWSLHGSLTCNYVCRPLMSLRLVALCTLMLHALVSSHAILSTLPRARCAARATRRDEVHRLTPRSRPDATLQKQSTSSIVVFSPPPQAPSEAPSGGGKL